jgi:hypothetical protein
MAYVHILLPGEEIFEKHGRMWVWGGLNSFGIRSSDGLMGFCEYDNKFLGPNSGSFIE